MTKGLGVWTAEDCALVLIDYQNEMFESAIPTTALAVVTELFRDWAVPLAASAREVIFWHFNEVPKLTDEVGVAAAEKLAASAQGGHWDARPAGRKSLRHHGLRRELGTRHRPDVAREGASVVGCDVIAEPAEETVEMVHAAGGRMVSLHPSRISNPAECARLVDLAVSEFGRIDVLYNLAATSHFSSIETVTDEEWDARH